MTIVLKKRYASSVTTPPISLSNAPFRRSLRVLSFQGADPQVRLFLMQIGLGEGEVLEKIRVAPLNDPFSVRIGNQMFSLRREVGDHVFVEVLP